MSPEESVQGYERGGGVVSSDAAGGRRANEGTNLDGRGVDRLDLGNLGELEWERMPSLTRGRYAHACCAVRGGVVVLHGGIVEGQGGRLEYTASV